MADVTFIVHSEWLDNISVLPVEQQDKVIAEIVRYGTGIDLMHEEDPTVQALVNMVKGRIDFSKDKYAQKVEKGASAGRKKKVDDKKIWELANKEGKKSDEIAKILGYSKSAVDHSEGWRKRKEDNFAEGGFSF